MENQAFGLKLIGIGVGCGMVSLVLFLLLIWVRTPRSEPD
jgi:hypothetical protein